MGSLVVVDLPPGVEDLLTVFQVSQRMSSDDFGLEGARQLFIFPLGLRMIRSSMGDQEAQTDGSGGQRCVLVILIITTG